VKRRVDNTRREALRLIGLSASATIGLPRLAAGGWQSTTVAAPAHVYTPKVFDLGQLRLIEALSEIIIPADDHSPGAKAAGVSQYIDLMVSEAGDSEKRLWIDGLVALDRMASSEYGRPLGNCTGHEQTSLLEKISKQEQNPGTLEERFFVALKRATIDGFYTSQVGIHQDLEYQGNTMVLNFKGCMHPEHKGS
jgi:gluconate 2-dehydrogenase gamma chain